MNILWGPIYKMYTLPHVIMMFIAILSLTLGIIFLKKKIKTEKQLDILLRILAGVTLAFLIASRISNTYHNIADGTEEMFFGEVRKYNWWMLIPHTYCSMAALILSIVVLSGKYKNNFIIDGLYSLVMLGMLTNIFRPDYINTDPFFELRTLGAIIYHVTMGYIIIALFLTNNLELKIKNIYRTVVMLSFVITFGVFELTALNFATAFSITVPMIKGFKLSYWYGCCLGYLLFDFVIRVAVFYYRNNKEKQNVSENDLS